ncbi:cation diffusion facilitator family transporter [Proteiniborus sp. MB09-C3]|uniref:cation diffusion facilitator family transporter n=1 Tax=Proteiniborus sp. MB09-C3 TaxID=3050072 RepID=UPI0025534E5A|nr:cation diffusion facilitator family transporter [Proteiniborus sp. MB09-C3]WIV12299.1 cation diffusion facilitator family transporter [Proteiniborus sp. MB09-C3]
MSSIKAVDDNERFRIASRITWLTIILNIILSIAKIGIGIISSSTAMIADGVHTVSDVASSLGIIVGFIISNKPEDSKHQYGHEKAESIAGFVLSLMLISVGIKIGYSSIELMISGTTKVPGMLALWAALASIVVKEFQYRITMNQGRRINSSALMADAWHHRSDALSSVGTLIGIGGARLGYKILDPLAGFIVSVIVVKVGIDLFLKGYNELMDSSIEEEELTQISNVILSETKIEEINDLKARRHGSKVFIDVEVCVDPNISVLEGHDIAEDVEKVIYDNLDNVKKVLVHVNPCVENCTEIKNK